MFNEGYSFPHPVLGNDDDMQGSLKVTLDFKRNDNRKIELVIKALEVDNQYIEKLIAEKKANFFIKVYCSSTLCTWLFEHSSTKIEIDENDLINKADVQVFLIAKSDIESFTDSSFNPQFANSVFFIKENEVIGVSGKMVLPIDKVNEKLGLGNIFKFFQQESNKPINFEHNRDKIYINYPVTKKGEHPPNALFQKNPWTAFQIFIVPALAEALRYIDNNKEKVEQLEWYQVIDSLLPESERDGNYFSQAQTLLEKELPILLSHEELMRKI